MDFIEREKRGLLTPEEKAQQAAKDAAFLAQFPYPSKPLAIAKPSAKSSVNLAPSVCPSVSLSDNKVLTLAKVKAMSQKAQSNLRRRIQTDVWFAAQRIFRNPSQPPLEPFHKEIADALPQPNPDLPLESWSPVKEAVILAFRGAAKTTIISGYVVQCILCDSDIRVKFVGGTLSKAAELVDMVRFHLNGNEIIQYLFSDFSPVSTSGNEFTIPNRQDMGLRDATLSSTSFRAQNAGGRADLLILDDAATEANMSTAYRVAKSVSQYDDLAPMVEPGGYTVFNGTRWAEDDIPASIAAAAQENGNDLTWLELPVWTLKDGDDIKQRDVTNNLKPDDVNILWRKLSADFLFKQYRKNPEAFKKQYLLRVDGSAPATSSVPFVKMDSVLLESLVVGAVTPQDNATYVLNGDLALVSESGKDACAIVAGIWAPEIKHLTVDSIILQKFTDEKEFLTAVGNLHGYCVLNSSNKIHFRIENVQAARELWQEKFYAKSIFADFQFPSFERDAREKRVARLFTAINAGQVHFSERCGNWVDILQQFIGWNPRKNQNCDLLDSIAQLWEYCETITTLQFVGFQLPPSGDFDFDYRSGKRAGEKPRDNWEEREAADSGYSSVSEYRAAKDRILGRR